MAGTLPPFPARERVLNPDGTMNRTVVAWFTELYRRVGQALAPSNLELGTGLDGVAGDVGTVQGQLASLDGRVDALEALPANQPLPSYTVATVPSAASNARKFIYVSNEVGGAVPAFSDGTAWRRVTDRAVIA